MNLYKPNTKNRTSLYHAAVLHVYAYPPSPIFFSPGGVDDGLHVYLEGAAAVQAHLALGEELGRGS